MTSFPLVGGRVARITRLDRCGRPDFTVPSAVSLVTEGFVSVEVSANVDTPDAITVTKANGKKCVNVQPAPQLTGYGVNINWCGVDPDAFALTTNQVPVLDPTNGKAIGFRANTGRDSAGAGFALEIWSEVPGVACPVDDQGNPLPQAQEASGYILFPFLQGGSFGDFTVENDAVSFVTNGAQSKDGSAWGFGPYAVTLDAQGKPGPLTDKIDLRDALHVQITYVSPPDETGGLAGVPAYKATASTTGNSLTPANSVPPKNAADATAQGLLASPTTAWTTGQYVQGSTAGAPGQFFWNGTAWAAGKAT